MATPFAVLKLSETLISVGFISEHLQQLLILDLECIYPRLHSINRGCLAITAIINITFESSQCPSLLLKILKLLFQLSEFLLLLSTLILVLLTIKLRLCQLFLLLVEASLKLLYGTLEWTNRLQLYGLRLKFGNLGVLFV